MSKSKNTSYQALSSQFTPLASLNIRAVLFDLDGTLIDTLDEFEVALSKMLEHFELPPVSRAEIASTIGKGSEHLVQSVLGNALARAQLPHTNESINAHFDKAMAVYYDAYSNAGEALAKVFPGVAEGLELLHNHRIPMAIVTNKPTRLALPILRAKGLDKWVQFVVAGDTFARRKPDPFPLLRACERLNVAPKNALMIGDSSNDAQAAHAANCPVVLMRYGYNHGKAIETVPAEGYSDSIADIAKQIIPAQIS